MSHPQGDVDGLVRGAQDTTKGVNLLLGGLYQTGYLSGTCWEGSWASPTQDKTVPKEWSLSNLGGGNT